MNQLDKLRAADLTNRDEWPKLAEEIGPTYQPGEDPVEFGRRLAKWMKRQAKKEAQPA